MKNLILILIIPALIAGFGCKKAEKSPEGPADIRIKNLSDMAFEEFSVDTSGGEHSWGALAAGGTSEYKRYEKAYRVAEITAVINGETFSTGTVNYNYEVVLGQGKFSYEVYIQNFDNKVLAIQRVIPEAPID